MLLPPGGTVYFPTLTGLFDVRVVRCAGGCILSVSLKMADTYSN